MAKRDDGENYYEYMLLYVDNCLSISEQPRPALERINQYFPMKPGSMGPPKLYLGAKMSKVTMPNGVTAWELSASKYVQDAVSDVEMELRRNTLVDC